MGELEYLDRFATMLAGDMDSKVKPRGVAGQVSLSRDLANSLEIVSYKEGFYRQIPVVGVQERSVVLLRLLKQEHKERKEVWMAALVALSDFDIAQLCNELAIQDFSLGLGRGVNCGIVYCVDAENIKTVSTVWCYRSLDLSGLYTFLIDNHGSDIKPNILQA